jgi:hypothetical protein
MSKEFASAFSIGQLVKLTVIQTAPIYGYVRAVTFTSSKVRYSLWVKEAATTLHNIDSAFVEAIPGGEAHAIEMPEDNYS